MNLHIGLVWCLGVTTLEVLSSSFVHKKVKFTMDIKSKIYMNLDILQKTGPVNAITLRCSNLNAIHTIMLNIIISIINCLYICQIW